MSFLILGFLTSLSLILAIGPQNIFVIEQGINIKLKLVIKPKIKKLIFFYLHLLSIK